MRRMAVVGAVVVGVVAAAGGAVVHLWPRDGVFPGRARWVLERPEVVEIYTLDPAPAAYSPPWPHGGKFGEWDYFGKARIGNEARQRGVIAAVEGDIDMDQEGVSSGCFEPRHGLRVERGGRVVTFEICYTCGMVRITEGKDYRWHRIKGTSHAVLDAALAAEGLRPVPERDPAEGAAGPSATNAGS